MRDQLVEDELSLLTQDSSSSAGAKAKPSRKEVKRSEAKAELQRRLTKSKPEPPAILSRKQTWTAAMGDPAALMAWRARRK